MKLIVDIPDSDYTAVSCEALYYIGSDKLAESVTTAFQTAIPYEEKPQWNYIKTRPLTEEEKEDLEAEEFEYMFDCSMPDHGEQVLILTKWGVELDVADNDYGYGLECRGDYDGVIAWLYVKDIMPNSKEKGGAEND